MVSVIIIATAIIEARAFNILPAGLTTAIVFPVFGSFRVEPTDESSSVLLIEAPDGDAETPGVEETLCSDMECDPQPDRRTSDDLSDASSDTLGQQRTDYRATDSVDGSSASAESDTDDDKPSAKFSLDCHTECSATSRESNSSTEETDYDLKGKKRRKLGQSKAAQRPQEKAFGRTPNIFKLCTKQQPQQDGRASRRCHWCDSIIIHPSVMYCNAECEKECRAAEPDCKDTRGRPESDNLTKSVHSGSDCDIQCEPCGVKQRIQTKGEPMRSKGTGASQEPMLLQDTKRRCEIQNQEREGLRGNAPRAEEEDVGYFHLRCMDADRSPDPRACLERTLHRLSQQFREKPTLPSDRDDANVYSKDAAQESRAIVIARKHCAFRGCAWEGETDAALHVHLQTKHGAAFEESQKEMSRIHNPEAVRQSGIASAYNEAIAISVRRGAPLAAYSIDRRCLGNYVEAMHDPELGSLTCFSCARRFPYASTRRRNAISWISPLRQSNVQQNMPEYLFCGLSPRQCERIFGLETYLDKYGNADGNNDQCAQRDELADWTLSYPGRDGDATILCCPEDRRCERDGCLDESVCCPSCEIPCCDECDRALRNPRNPEMPPAALSNDMMVFYAPREVYTQKVTVMEMICASVCLTSMICFTLEKRYRKERPFDDEVHMQRHRQGARGNATSFPLPWQDLLLQLKETEETDNDNEPPELPRSGEELSNFVSILLKTGDDEDTKESLSKFIHQAIVRRHVVVELIENAHRRGHRAYKNVNLERMRARAKEVLPENGIMPEIAKLLPLDDSMDKIQVQKAATPVNAPSDLEQAATELQRVRPNGVVLEKSSLDEADINVQRVTALKHMTGKLGLASSDSESSMSHPSSASEASSEDDRHGEEKCLAGGVRDSSTAQTKKKKVNKYALVTGNKLIDQFEPWYFGVAFAFLFKYCTGMPDPPAFMKKARHRRSKDAPRVELEQWMQIMARRVEGQLSRDWNFGYVSWNLWFRTAVNLSRTVYAYETRSKEETQRLTPKQLETGAIEICRALRGKYTDPAGKNRPVNGDMTKVRYVPGLSLGAKKLLQNLEHTSRKLPGTQETRRQMRFDTHANRIKYGVPVFVTFSPDERHSNLMIRFSRTRRNDPVLLTDRDARKYCGRGVPRLDRDEDEVTASIGVDKLIAQLPTYDERRAILARDPLASVDGFRTLVLFAYEYLFGMRVCPDCPDCNHMNTSDPCQDLFGSNASAEGGIFGRVDAGYTSIEAQKSTGSLHAHTQLFVQCLHQHTPLAEIMEILSDVRGSQVVTDYLNYKTHVCREIYSEKCPDVDARLGKIESEWPEYASDTVLTSCPAYLSAGACADRDRCVSREESQKEGRKWRKDYVDTDVQRLQERRQHHVHIYSEQTKQREPLPACRRKDDPNKCKSGYPHTLWLIDRCVILCQGLLEKMGLPSSGRRTKLGSLFGPMGHEYLNGTHPAMLAAQRCNSDVQLPYRFPITPQTHDASCGRSCSEAQSKQKIIEAAQVAQDAQAGYACDYCNKRQPLAFNEIRECCKGHQDLNQKLRGESVNYIGKRHAMRLMSDAYGKGIVRGQVECTNLRANFKGTDTTHAESFKTSQTQAFYGREYCDMIERLNDGRASGRKVYFGTVDCRRGQRRQVRYKDVAIFYGQRPKHDWTWHLSPYEFTMLWEPELVSFPSCLASINDPEHHVEMTAEGVAKLSARGRDDAVDWEPGVDYIVKEGGGEDWLPFPDVPATASFRHTWVLRRRSRPRVPTFAGAPVPRRSVGEQERAAMITQVYFHPWTLRAAEADEHVKYAGSLREQDTSWHQCLEKWLNGNLLCEEAKRYVGNFLAVYRVRPKDDSLEDGGRSEDLVSDVELEISHETLAAAVQTRPGGRRDGGEDDEEPNEEKHRAEDGMILAQAIWGDSTRQRTKIEVEDKIYQGQIAGILKEARASQRKEDSLTSQIAAAEARYGKVDVYGDATAEDIQRWLHKVKTQKKNDGRAYLNDEQYVMVELVAQRIMKEMQAGSDESADFGEPLRWLLHGGPGTGKTHVIKVIKDELFGEILGWDMGVEFQIVALQAVMANLLGGDTIHHACGIAAFRRGVSSEQEFQNHMEIAKKVLQWRWLIIDEISMVSSKLLAEIDVKLRDVIREAHTARQTTKGKVRPFGGLNVLCSGDLWQLEPPDGGFIGSLPCEFLQHGRKFDRQPTIAHGQSLFWGGGERGIQGVTELQKCERTADLWLLSVQKEIRNGSLTEESHRFLHGLPTKVPGSWVDGRVSCGNARCARLVRSTAHQKSKSTSKELYIIAKECGKCKEERRSKHLVAVSANDPRFKEPKFAVAPAIFANNDVKYDANKKRASLYGEIKKSAITWSCAKDTPSAEAMQERPDLMLQKLSWLQRHDRESGDLYGMLPLIVGMPVVLTDHLDRNPEKQLLRGKMGYIHSWVLAGKEESRYQAGERVLQKLPSVVMVKFYNEDGSEVAWKLPGLKEPGLYPIEEKKKSWYLDKGRKHPVLKIKRRQIPLAPAFAMTAHASQGQTLKNGAVVDLRLGRGTSNVASYVAMTRVKRREDLLIYRSFDKAAFTKGVRKGPPELLQLLRGEAVDWESIEKEYLPRSCCSLCGFTQFKDEFFLHQWNRADKNAVCKACMREMTAKGTPIQCVECCCWKAEVSFPEAQRTYRSCAKRVCDDCVEKRRCEACGESLTKNVFTESEWKRATKRTKKGKQGKCINCMQWNREQKACCGCQRSLPESAYSSTRMWRRDDDRRKCKECSRKGVWNCTQCKRSLEICNFEAWLRPRSARKNDGTARCNTCYGDQREAERRLMQQSIAHVQKRSTNLAATMIEVDRVDKRAAQIRDERDNRKKRRTEIEPTAARVSLRELSADTTEQRRKKTRPA